MGSSHVMTANTNKKQVLKLSSKISRRIAEYIIYCHSLNLLDWRRGSKTIYSRFDKAHDSVPCLVFEKTDDGSMQLQMQSKSSQGHRFPGRWQSLTLVLPLSAFFELSFHWASNRFPVLFQCLSENEKMKSKTLKTNYFAFLRLDLALRV